MSTRVASTPHGALGLTDDDLLAMFRLVLTARLLDEAALRAVGMGLLDDHVRHCVRESIEQGSGEAKIEELMAAVGRLAAK